MAIDIDALLAPISDDIPAGENLEYSEVAELERQAAGTPGKLDPETREMVGGEEPDWRKVRDLGISIFAQTKDLRVAVILTRALLSLEGLPGLGQGLQLIGRMCEQFWDTVHPGLDPDDSDPIERLNALANLDDAEAMIKTLRATRIVESREAGAYTVRDLDLALGRISAEEGKEAPTIALMAIAWQTGDPEANAARRAAVENALTACNELITLFRDKTNDSPNIDTMRDYLKRVKTFYDEVADDGSGESEEEGEALAEGGGAVAGTGGGIKAGGAIGSRADAIKVLEQVAVYVRKSEPSSPAPMFIDRAVKILKSDFATIVRELMPDSKAHIELLGGISLDEPEA
ncbi:type VI secretion system protein TssA [Piscinibacter sakaiensis]|uniref:type VI secretion system protein TssA n=1 Tax=Piscinibacter sakaiensis TaxID=1547922 RepID=UPI003AAED50D